MKRQKKVPERPNLLVVIRHAESMRNKIKKGSVYFLNDESRKKIQGIPDHKISITGKGKRQAKKAGKALREKFGIPDYIYHSGYARTIETMEGILSAYLEKEKENINIRMNSFIRERDSGYAYDMTTEEAEKAFPWLKEYWQTFGGFFSRPPGGESLADVTSRVHTFLDTLFRDRKGKKIFLVTHGGTIRCLRFLLERRDYDWALSWPEGEVPKNCSVTTYEYSAKEKRLMLKEYNAVYY